MSPAPWSLRRSKSVWSAPDRAHGLMWIFVKSSARNCSSSGCGQMQSKMWLAAPCATQVGSFPFGATAPAEGGTWPRSYRDRMARGFDYLGCASQPSDPR